MGDPAAKAAVELLSLASAEVRETLVWASGDEMLRAQGAAQKLYHIIKSLTTDPTTIGQETKGRER